MSNALDQWFHGAVVIVAGTLFFIRDAGAQSARESSTTAIVSSNVAAAAEGDTRVPMVADDFGVVLFQVYEGDAAPLPHWGFIQVDGVVAQPICRLPCAPARNVMQNHEFFFAGREATSSERFRVEPQGPPRGYRVKKGDRRLLYDGIGLIVVGSLPVAFGLMAVPLSTRVPEGELVYDNVDPNPTPRNGPNESPETTYRRELLTAGIASLVIGGIGLGIGIPLYRAGRTTFVQYDPRVMAFRF